MTVSDALECAVVDCAANLELPLGLEGRPFVAPAATHLRCRIEMDETRAAALGSSAPKRVDGGLRITAVSLASSGPDEARAKMAAVADFFQPGRGLDVDVDEGAGEIVFGAPVDKEESAADGRVRVCATFRFCGILFS